MTDLLKDQRVVAVVVLLLTFLTTKWLLDSLRGEPVTPESLIGEVPSPNLLNEHTKEFKQGVVKVTDGLYMAIGFAIANSILIEAPEGAIIVDTTESVKSGMEVMAAFRNITKSPVKAVVYTHNHADHMQGTSAFIDKDSKVDIWAHEDFPRLVDSTATVMPLTYSRAVKQFGIPIQDRAPRAFRNAGIGARLRINDGSAEPVPPTHLMKGETQDVLMAGLPVTIVHIPGETYDQIGVWIPSKKAFLCGDDLYRAFPNLYAIRGTPTRDLLHWVSSLEKMLSYRPEFLVPSHSRHLFGWQYIETVLTDYRDAIKHIHDQTVRYMNKGMFPDDIVTKVQLPESVRKNPFLQTFYGNVEWSVRAVFDRYMGWFSGNIAELSRHSTVEKAKRMIALAGGENSLLKVAKEAIEQEDYKWALELASQIIAVQHDHAEAKAVRLSALKSLASQQVSANGRNYYLTTALEDYGFVETKLPLHLRKAAVMFMSPMKLFTALSLRLKAEEVKDVNAALVFDLTDIEEVYTLRIRNSVMDVIPGMVDDWTVKVTVPFETWKGLIAGNESPLSLYMNGGLQVEGGMMAFKEFMSYIDTD